MRKLDRVKPRQQPSWKMTNELIDRVNLLSKITGTSGVRVNMTPHGVNLRGTLKQPRPPAGGQEVFRARTTEAASATAFITANLYGGDGVEIQSGELSGITVNCSIIGGANLNAAIPRLENDDDFFVSLLPTISGSARVDAYWCTTIFQASTDCT